MFGLTKGGNLPNIITYNFIWANIKTESFVYLWLGARAMFDMVLRDCQSKVCHFKCSDDCRTDVIQSYLLF